MVNSFAKNPVEDAFYSFSSFRIFDIFATATDTNFICAATATDTNVATATDTNVATATDTNIATATSTTVTTGTDTSVSTSTDTDAPSQFSIIRFIKWLFSYIFDIIC